MARDRTSRNGICLPNVQYHIFWHDSTLEASSVRVLTSTPKYSRWLNYEVGNLFNLIIEETRFVLGILFSFLSNLFFPLINWSILFFFSLFFEVFFYFCEVEVIEGSSSKRFIE